MTKLLNIVSATIVAIFILSAIGPAALAKPLDTMPDQTPSREETEPKMQDENMAITTPPPMPKEMPKPNVDYFSHRQSLTLRIGAAAPFSDLEEKETILGFAYMFPKFLSPRFEAGADVHNKDDKGHVHAGIREIYFEKQRVRPTVKIGISHEVHSIEGLASFANSKHYFCRGSAGADISLNVDWSVRLEIEGMVGLKKSWAVGSLGLSRNW